MKAGEVNKSWYEVAGSDTIWQPLCIARNCTDLDSAGFLASAESPDAMIVDEAIDVDGKLFFCILLAFFSLIALIEFILKK